jgi:hypothetical protein
VYVVLVHKVFELLVFGADAVYVKLQNIESPGVSVVLVSWTVLWWRW